MPSIVTCSDGLRRIEFSLTASGPRKAVRLGRGSAAVPARHYAASVDLDSDFRRATVDRIRPCRSQRAKTPRETWGMSRVDNRLQLRTKMSDGRYKTRTCDLIRVKDAL